MTHRKPLFIMLAVLVAACTTTVPSGIPAVTPPASDYQLRSSIASLEQEHRSGEDLLYRAALPAEIPPMLSSMTLSRTDETGFVIGFRHQGRQSFIWHVADESELPACAEIETDRRQCVRREAEGPRPYLVYLVEPLGSQAAPSTEALADYWENVEIMVAPDSPPPWFARLANDPPPQPADR